MKSAADSFYLSIPAPPGDMRREKFPASFKEDGASFAHKE
jgi:hypothetical protein